MAIGGMEVFTHDHHFPGKKSGEHGKFSKEKAGPSDANESTWNRSGKDRFVAHQGSVRNESKASRTSGRGTIRREAAGVKNLKPHSQKHYADSPAAKAGLKDTRNEYRKPSDHKDVPTAKMAKGANGKSTAVSSKKDSVWGGYGKGSPR